MKTMFKRITASIMAVTALAVGMGGMSANAENVASGSKAASPRGTIYGNIDLSWYSPIGGVNVYTVKATTSVYGVTGSYTLHTGLELVDHPSGDPRQSNYKNGSSASVSANAVYGDHGVAYSNHEVRGASTGILYLESKVMTL